jgi:hypothetical protein
MKGSQKPLKFTPELDGGGQVQSHPLLPVLPAGIKSAGAEPTL